MGLRLRSLAAENYKSLRQFRLEVQDLTVFLGANGVGKSNIFDALRFIKDRVERGFGNALVARGGMESCAWRGLSQRAPHFLLRAEFDPGLEYSLNVGMADSGYSASEQLRSTSAGRVWIETSRGQTTFHDVSGGGVSTGGDTSLVTYLGRAQQPEPERAFIEEVRGWQFYNFMPPLMRFPGPAKKEAYLDEDGRNFSPWFHGIQSSHRRTFEEIVAILKDATQTIRDVASELTERSQVFVFLEEEGLQGPLPIGAFSDGTLRFLAQIAVLRQPVAPTLLCLEEPENYIHPRLLEILSEEIKTAALRFPIFINTHSPLLVDKFEPQMIAIVERTKEGTVVVPVGSRDDLQKLIQEMQLELGEVWYSGALGGVRSRLD